MKMKRIILALTMLVAIVATASAQAEIKFDKAGTQLRYRSKRSNPVQKATFTFTNVGNKPLDYQPGYCQLRLYRTFLYQEAYRSRSEGTD